MDESEMRRFSDGVQVAQLAASREEKSKGMGKEQEKEESPSHVEPLPPRRRRLEETASYNGERVPKLNLASISLALSQGWNPNTAWTEEEIDRRRPRDSGCLMFLGGRDPWCHVNTALHKALVWDDFEVAECLLKHGADINQPNAAGLTVLHEAFERSLSHRDLDYDGIERAAWIIKHGADLHKQTEARTNLVPTHHEGERERYIEYRTQGGLSPLRMVMRLGSLTKIQKLVEAGADVNLPFDAKGRWRPLDIALMKRQLEVMGALEQAGASLSVHVEEETDISLLQKQAEALMFFCFSRSNTELNPPPGSEHVYRLVLQTDEFKAAWACRGDKGKDEGGDEGPSRYQAPVDAFSRILSTMARTKDLYAVPESYCARCRDLATKNYLVWSSEDTTYEHAASLRELEHSTALNGCPFCNLILDAIDADLEKDGKKTESEPTNSGSGSGSSQLTDSPDGPVEISLTHHRLQITCGHRTSLLEVNLVEENLLHDLLDHQDDRELGTGSPRALALAKAWLKSCMKNHPKCHRSQDVSEPVLPTRILDVACGTGEGHDHELGKICLVETHAEMKGVYCALSYCWEEGSDSTGTALTTRANLESHKKGIPVESLPAVIQDAITTTRAFGFRYLWVDSLCILQNDPEDWDSEVAKMGDVYINASLTISTLMGSGSGTKGSETLFKPRKQRQPSPLPFPAAGAYFEDTERCVMAVHPLMKEGTLGSKTEAKFRGPMHSRGWALQAQTLSNRILWFGPGHIMWECVSLQATEPIPSFTADNSSRESDFWHTKPQQMRKYLQELLKVEGEFSESRYFHSRWRISGHTRDDDDRYRAWEELVAEYTTREFAKRADRIPAMLGLGHMMGSILKCDFVAGAWRGDLFLRSLLWSVYGRRTADTVSQSPMSAPMAATSPSSPPPPPPHDASSYPSWTWASKPDYAIDYFFVPSLNGVKFTWPASLVSWDVTLQGKSQSGATGSITLRGPLGKLMLEEADDMQETKPMLLLGRHGDSSSDDEPTWSSFLPRRGASAEGVEAVVALQYCWYLDVMKAVEWDGGYSKPSGFIRYAFDPAGWTYRLFLEPIDDQKPPRAFRRIGVGRALWDAKNVSVQDVAIV